MPYLEVFYLDGFSWTDLLDFLEIPHYTNEHRTDTKPKSFEIRTVLAPASSDYDPPTEPENVQILVVWDGNTRPTDELVIAKCVAEFF